MPYLSIAILSMPSPKARPLYLSESILEYHKDKFNKIIDLGDGNFSLSLEIEQQYE